MARLADFYQEVETSIGAAEAIYAQIEQSLPLDVSIDAAELLDFNEIDYSGTLWALQSTINRLSQMRVIERFERVTQDQMLAILRSFEEGTPGKHVVSLDHIKTEYDTLRGLELRYRVPWSEILTFNGLTAGQFNALSPGAVISIPSVRPIERGLKNMLVFGDQSGINILGKDIPNKITAGTDGDIRVLEPAESFVQSMQNVLVTLKGEIAYYESFGADLRIGEEYGSEALLPLLELRIIHAFEDDPRVFSVEIVQRQTNTDSISLEVEIQSIVGQMQPVRMTIPNTELFLTSERQVFTTNQGESMYVPGEQ